MPEVTCGHLKMPSPVKECLVRFCGEWKSGGWTEVGEIDCLGVGWVVWGLGGLFGGWVGFFGDEFGRFWDGGGIKFSFLEGFGWFLGILGILGGFGSFRAFEDF